MGALIRPEIPPPLRPLYVHEKPGVRPVISGSYRPESVQKELDTVERLVYTIGLWRWRKDSYCLVAGKGEN